MSFRILEREEQIMWLQSYAYEALRFFNLPDATLELVDYTNNAVFEVVDLSSQLVQDTRYALRIHRPGLRKPLVWIQSELMWLSAIRQHTSLVVPKPIEAVYTGSLQGMQEAVHCTLLGWVPGTVCNLDAMTSDQLWLIGEFAALLHTFSETFTPPDGFQRPYMDLEGFFGEESPYRSDAEKVLFAGKPQVMMSEAAIYIQKIMQCFGRTSDLFGLVHGDLIAKNILFDDGSVGAIDFDDCSFSYYLYELTPVLWMSRHSSQFSEFYAAIWQGYTSIRPQPNENKTLLNALILGRHIASCRWVAGNAAHPSIRGNARQIIAQRSDEIEYFLRDNRF